MFHFSSWDLFWGIIKTKRDPGVEAPRTAFHKCHLPQGLLKSVETIQITSAGIGADPPYWGGEIVLQVHKLVALEMDFLLKFQIVKNRTYSFTEQSYHQDCSYKYCPIWLNLSSYMYSWKCSIFIFTFYSFTGLLNSMFLHSVLASH